ncbi:hypothetical protein BJ742DRAFT_855363 [Cladochytrium replicatum]|nr:hypothetical protein BJ742DRAFT_855363 [Cladochytrium replicatum]
MGSAASLLAAFKAYSLSRKIAIVLGVYMLVLKDAPNYKPRQYGEPLDQHTYKLYMILIEHEFPNLVLVSTEFALFKTYSIPTISKLLRNTGEFRRNGVKRVEDTTLLLQEYAYYPHKPERGPVAINRVNDIHGHYKISNDDFLYTLAQFMIQPVEWIKLYGYRPLEKHEEEAIFMLYKVMGEKMNIRDIPDTLEEVEKWAKDYEKKCQVYAESNAHVGEYTVKVVTDLIPSFLHPAVRALMYTLIPQGVRVALDYPEPNPLLSLIMGGLLRSSGWFIRLFMLPRFVPLNRLKKGPDSNGRYRPTYSPFVNIYGKDGYKIEELGPTFGKSKTANAE